MGGNVSAIDAECGTCGGDIPENECPQSKRSCGHHCNCVWVHDECHWCGAVFGDEDDPNFGVPAAQSAPSTLWDVVADAIERARREARS